MKKLKDDANLITAILDEEHIEGCIDCIFDSTLRNDPISTGLRITKGEYYDCLKLILKNTLKDGISLVVTDKKLNKVVACAISTDFTKMLGEEVINEDAKDENLKIYSEIEGRMNAEFSKRKFKPGEAAYADFYCVRKDYKKTGLSKEIFLESLKLCHQKGFNFYCGTVFQGYVLDLFTSNNIYPLKKIELNDLPLKSKKFLEYMKNGANIILIDLKNEGDKFMVPKPNL